MALENINAGIDYTIPSKVNTGNLDISKPMLAASEIQKNVAATRNLMSESDRRDYDRMSEQFGRAANDILQMPQGPERTQRWNDYAVRFHKEGYLNDTELHQWYNNPSDLVLRQAVAHSTAVSQHAKFTGTEAENEAAGRAPYQAHVTEPNQRLEFPGAEGGAPRPTNPLWTPRPVATTPIQPQPGGPQPQPGVQPGAPMPIQPGAQPMTGQPNFTPSVQPNTTPAEARTANAQDPYYHQAPVTRVAPTVPGGPGVLRPGRLPEETAAIQGAHEKFDKDINPTANAASKTSADLHALESELKGGKITSDRLAELKTTVAGYIYGVTQDMKLSQSLTGVDLAQQEVFNKGSTRMGLQFARQTEGAREAVQAIRIALGANPSMLNTKEGNLKVINTMLRANEYDIERSRAATGYYQKQVDNVGYGHLMGFDPWFNRTNSPSAFMSKAVPYSLPSDPNDMQPGVTYETKDGRTGVWDPVRKGLVINGGK